MKVLVLILGRTWMARGICIGGLTASLEPVRLIPKGELCNPKNTKFQIGQVWELDICPRANATRPHVEDHDLLGPGTLIRTRENLDEWLRNHIEPWQGDHSCLFGGTLQIRPNGTAYVPMDGPLPNCSTGFWILPGKMDYKPFSNDDREQVPYYRLTNGPLLKVKYVGTLPVARLPKVLTAGTLVRLSLAHDWPKAPREEDRGKFFLQLSGWFPHPDPQEGN